MEAAGPGTRRRRGGNTRGEERMRIGRSDIIRGAGKKRAGKKEEAKEAEVRQSVWVERGRMVEGERNTVKKERPRKTGGGIDIRDLEARSRRR